MAYDIVLTALSDPTRRGILDSLRSGPKSVGDIARNFPISQPAVSQHLRILGDAQLVTRQRMGARRIYSLRPEGLAELRAYVESFWDDVLGAFANVDQDQTDPKKS